MPPTSFKLNTGAEIPAVGLGTWQSPPGAVASAVSYALIEAGYRHIDAAYCYANEDEVGEGLKKAFDSGIKREDVFVTTKLWTTYLSRAELGLDKSLKSLGLGYVDLFLMHWPVPLNPNGNHEKFPTLPDGSRDLEKGWDFVKAWGQMEDLLSTGKVKAIGVSNFSIPFLDHLIKNSKVVPAVNQIENHPLLPQDDILVYCKEKGIVVTAYSPLGSTGAKLMEQEKVKKVAEKHGVGAGTILLSYHPNRGVVVIPKSVTESRIKENSKIIDLDAEDLELLGSIHKENGVKRFITPPWPMNFGFADWNQDQYSRPF